MIQKMLFSALTALALCGFTAHAQKSTTLNGSWKSESVENLGQAWGVREFSFDKSNWEIRFTMYGDSAMTFPLFTFRATGTYVINGAKKDESNPAVFSFSKKYVTVHTDNSDVLKNLGMTDCGLSKGVEKDITETGCSFLVSKNACGQEYDLVAQLKGKLYLGARPADGNMCTEDRRPKSLGLPLVRK
jgi:hypothetical protein